jgi:hypothetical protein
MCEPCSGGFRVFYNVFDVLVCVCSAVYCRERVHRWIVGWFRWWVACVFAVGDVAPLTHPILRSIGRKIGGTPVGHGKSPAPGAATRFETVSVGFAQNAKPSCSFASVVRPGAHANLTFKGPLDCVQTTWKHEGMRGFYRGMSLPLFGTMLETASLFSINASVRSLLTDHTRTSDTSLGTIYVAGGITGKALEGHVWLAGGSKRRIRWLLCSQAALSRSFSHQSKW